MYSYLYAHVCGHIYIYMYLCAIQAKEKPRKESLSYESLFPQQQLWLKALRGKGRGQLDVTSSGAQRMLYHTLKFLCCIKPL